MAPRVGHGVRDDSVVKIAPRALERDEGTLVDEDDSVHEDDGDDCGKPSETSPEHRRHIVHSTAPSKEQKVKIFALSIF